MQKTRTINTVILVTRSFLLLILLGQFSKGDSDSADSGWQGDYRSSRQGRRPLVMIEAGQRILCHRSLWQKGPSLL